MNNARRKSLNKIINTLANAKLDIESVYEEENDVYENYPENLQSTDKYEAMENAVDELENAIDLMDEVIEALENATA